MSEIRDMAIEEKFNINLNQNLWGLVVTYTALGIAEHWCLPWLFRFSCVAALFITISVLLTVGAYTWNYCRNKFRSEESS